jgi:hypothetical protein
MDSGLAASRRPGMTPCVGHGLDLASLIRDKFYETGLT